MLVFARKLGEKIFIGDDIVVEIVEIRNKQAKVGITAPSSVQIDREEIRIRKNKNPKPPNSLVS
jgi:carbon storage regulator